MMRLNPSEAALYALVAIALVSLGAILTGSTETFSIAERGSVLAGIVAVLAGVYFVGRNRNHDDHPDDRERL